MARLLIIGLGFLGIICFFVFGSVPRLWSELRHADEFVPAQNLKITSAKCTNWNLVMFNKCTVTFDAGAAHPPQEITDWRFGRAPTGRVVLLQRRDDPAFVTTDVSIRTLWNRIAVVVAAALLAGLVAIGLPLRLMRRPGMGVRPATGR